MSQVVEILELRERSSQSILDRAGWSSPWASTGGLPRFWVTSQRAMRNQSVRALTDSVQLAGLDHMLKNHGMPRWYLRNAETNR